MSKIKEIVYALDHEGMAALATFSTINLFFYTDSTWLCINELTACWKQSGTLKQSYVLWPEFIWLSNLSEIAYFGFGMFLLLKW